MISNKIVCALGKRKVGITEFNLVANLISASFSRSESVDCFHCYKM